MTFLSSTFFFVARTVRRFWHTQAQAESGLLTFLTGFAKRYEGRDGLSDNQLS
jgi:hypothetical protein